MSKLDIEALLGKITVATNALKQQQNACEEELKQFQDCRKQITNEVNAWYQRLMSDEMKEEILPEEEQYKQPITYVFEKRVVPGRDWESTQAGKRLAKGLKGVVFKIHEDGHCTVKWDDGSKSKCNWGKNDKFDIKVVAFDIDYTPIEPKDQVKQPVSWLIGRKVKRGTDWKGGMIDNNKPGIVVCCSSSNKVIVDWEGGVRSECRWGYDKFYDIEAIF